MSEKERKDIADMVKAAKNWQRKIRRDSYL